MRKTYGKPKARTVRVYLCDVCGHIFRTVKFPRKCNKCGIGKLILIDKYKAKPIRRSRKSAYLTLQKGERQTMNDALLHLLKEVKK